MKITAAVVHERSGPFTIEQLDLCDPRADELLVEVTATGMCATDLHGRDAYFQRFLAMKARALFGLSVTPSRNSRQAIRSSWLTPGAANVRIAKHIVKVIACTRST